MLDDKQQNLELYKTITVKRIEKDTEKIMKICSQFSFLSSLNKRKLICLDLYHQFISREAAYKYDKVVKKLKKEAPDDFNWDDLERFIDIESKDIAKQYFEKIRNFFIKKFGEDITNNADLLKKLMFLGAQRLM